jgi:hypothetical protein
MFQYVLSVFQTWPAKMLRLMILIFFVWLLWVMVAVLINAFPDGNGVLQYFH